MTVRRAASKVNAEDGGRDAAQLRAFNLERVLGVAMDRDGPFTRAVVSEVTGLSAPTVGSLSSHLIRSGLVRDLGAGPSRGGRRPSFMEFNARHGFVVGIDLAITQSRLAVADLRGELVSERLIPTPKERGPVALLSRIGKEMRALLRDSGVPVGRLLAVAAGAPGAVDRKRGMVVDLAPNLKGWSRVPMAAILRRALGAPVVVENDVNLAILGERWRGAARGHDTCAFLVAGTGIGAGIIVNGELHHGHHFLAGEVALMCMGREYVEKDFGSRGCLETLAGRSALAARWSASSAGDEQGRIGDLFDAARHGDAKARQIVNEAATLLGMATANLSIVLDPSIVVLGGPLMTQSDLLARELRRIVSRIVPSPPQIVATELQETASLWGSLLVAMTEARERIRQQLRRNGRSAA
ncbi:MAG: ROK family protein [Luteitalea sp.]|nr:ROK family protein [Luteitalea sp.]